MAKRFYEIQEHTAEVKIKDINQLTYDDCFNANIKFGNDDYEIVKKFESLEEAKEAFEGYTTDYRHVGINTYDVTYYELHFNDYDEYGDFATNDSEDTFIDCTEFNFKEEDKE